MVDTLNQNFEFVLASQSPRRQSILKEMGLHYTMRKSKLEEETYPNDLLPFEVAEYLSEQKAKHTDLMSDNEVIITADTIVCCDNKILGKPESYSDAFQMLLLLSNKKHSVITGITLHSRSKTETFHASTTVEFAKLTDEEIRNYIERYKPYDKAGSYGIQEWIGYIGIKHIEGSFFNVVGLPSQKLYERLITWLDALNKQKADE